MQNEKLFLYRLTALWAFVESGLGGIMHALQIPFTGFFIGGLAVILIGLIAFYSKNFFNGQAVTRHILNATLLVCLVKLTVSPHSPIGAYFAVIFQGLLGSLLYRLPAFKITSVIFGIIALVESAVQKLVILTLVFGKSIWTAIDIFFSGLKADLSLPLDFSFSFWLILIYILVYAIWGALLGLWIGQLPAEIQIRSADVIHQFRLMEHVPLNAQENRRKNKPRSHFLVGSLLLFIIFILLLKGHSMNILIYVVLRTIAVLLGLFYIVQPVWRWLLAHLLKNKLKSHQLKVQEIVSIIPEINNLTKFAFTIASSKSLGFKKYKEFILVLLILSLFQLKKNE